VDKSLVELTIRIRRRRKLFTGFISVIAGFLFVASSHTAAGTNLRTGGVEDLRGLVLQRANSVAELQGNVNSVQTKVDALSAEKITPELNAKLVTLEGVTGLSSVTGSALQVTLNDAPRASGSVLPEGIAPDDLVVHQQDVQAVVNAFWRSGAVAVQVMDQRIISSSAIRCVGNTLLLQGRVYSPPFIVTGIGSVTALQDGLSSEPGVQIYREYVDRLGLGWKVKILNSTTLPQWQGSLN
jgi:uncharacterized protein YlxW (UPF0749 family)